VQSISLEVYWAVCGLVMGPGTVSLDVVRPAPPIENLLNSWEGGEGGGGALCQSFFIGECSP
jgi:hypothetical protein